jgi:hypothetical protein
MILGTLGWEMRGGFAKEALEIGKWHSLDVHVWIFCSVQQTKEGR